MADLFRGRSLLGPLGPCGGGVGVGNGLRGRAFLEDHSGFGKAACYASQHTMLSRDPVKRVTRKRLLTT